MRPKTPNHAMERMAAAGSLLLCLVRPMNNLERISVLLTLCAVVISQLTVFKLRS